MTPRPAPASMTVELGPRSYDILVGGGLLADAGRLARPLLAEPRVIVVTDANVAGHWLATVEKSLDDAGIAHDGIVLEAGEQTKDFAHFERLTGRLLDAHAERTTTLMALGGGVIGDITGFAAAVTLRGMDYIQLPTTLLAQVDSAVGGKTAINVQHGKNLVGAFHQPRLVLADTSTLDTLPKRELRAGYAEVVKYGVLGDAKFFAWLEKNGFGVIDGDADARRHAVLISCRAKAAIVAADEREHGQRALLNLGHTFGHAIEAMSGYGDALHHGEAVAIGMVMACDLSVRLGLCPPTDADRVRRHLQAAGLPVGLAGIKRKDWSADALIARMGQDKKVRAGTLTFVLVRGIGKAFVTRDVALADVRRVLDEELKT
ncbi:MAG: 3-dehydroquinate synthase [Rhodospirillales bacterium]|nr:3-dehydroquinate synthase [Rhodospirillales bacterium]